MVDSAKVSGAPVSINRTINLMEKGRILTDAPLLFYIHSVTDQKPMEVFTPVNSQEQINRLLAGSVARDLGAL